MQKLLIASILCLAASFAPASVRAQQHDTTEAFELKVDGAAGTWFPSAMTRKMLASIEQLQDLNVTIAEQSTLLATKDERLSIKDQRILQVNEALTLADTAQERMAGVVEAAVRGQRQAEEDLEVWYRSPEFLVSVGAVGVIIVEVAAIVVYKALEAK